MLTIPMNFTLLIYSNIKYRKDKDKENLLYTHKLGISFDLCKFDSSDSLNYLYDMLNNLFCYTTVIITDFTIVKN